MDFLRPTTLGQALDAKAERPAAVPIAGGTDVMVELNFGTRRPEALLDLNRVGELTGIDRDHDVLRVGACVSYARIIGELGGALPGLAMAARTVGSPQIRNRGTVGGNLGAASPAGDMHPVLLACGAQVETASVRGRRVIPVAEFFTGPKRSVLAPDELITAVMIERAQGPQQFGLCLWPRGRPTGGRIGTGIGSAGPVPLRAGEAEEFLDRELASAGLWESRAALPEQVARRFGELVAGAARPIDDVRGSAAYRRHALSVLGRRTLGWAWDAYREEATTCA
jgi:CO/xanthine dehydrogenase FAD-binding subunit